MRNVVGESYRLLRFVWENVKEYDNIVAPDMGARVIKKCLKCGLRDSVLDISGSG
jgi:hypothetical protein